MTMANSEEVIDGELAPNGATFHEMLLAVHSAESRTELALEKLSDLYNQIDNVGWLPLAGITDREVGPSLTNLIQLAGNTRTMFAANPMAQNGVEIRVGYIWGTGIDIKAGTAAGGASVKTAGVPTLTKANQRSLFSTQAQMELEIAAATDGNLFFLLDKAKKKAIWIPLEQIAAVVTDEDDAGQVTHYRREWTVTVTNVDGTTSTKSNKVYYPAWDFVGPKTGFGGVPPVDKNQAMIHISFNTQRGWLFGLPDLFNVTWWISGYKEYIEAGFSVTKALAKFAIKSTAPTKAGMNRAATKMAASAPAVPGGSGPGYGQTANTSGGVDVAAISKSGAEFDFDSGRAIAALTAMGLGIDVDALLGENKVVGDNQLTAATVKRMILRQGLWDDFLTSVATYFGIPNVNIRFPPVRTVAVHRAVQAVVTAAASGTMFPEEVRGMVVQMFQEYGIETKPGMPESGEWAKFANPIAPANATADQGNPNDLAHPGTSPQSTPNPTAAVKTKKTPAGDLASGDNTQRNSNK